MSFNFLGNFSGPLVCGWVAEWTGSLAWGIRAVLCMGVVGVIPMALSAFFATRRAAKQALLDNAAAQAALRQQQQQSEEDEGYHSDSSEEFGVGAPHAVGAPPTTDHHDHHYYTSNMSIMAALEEVVASKSDPLASSARRESPRHADSDIELVDIIAGGGGRCAAVPQQHQRHSCVSSPAGGAGNSSFRPTNNSNSNSNSNNVTTHNGANLFANSVVIDALAAGTRGNNNATPLQRTPHIRSHGSSPRGTPQSTTRHRHEHQFNSSTSGAVGANDGSNPPSHGRGRSSSYRSERQVATPLGGGLVQLILPAGDEDADGDVDGIARGMCGVYPSTRRSTTAAALHRDHDDDRDRSEALDSAQFNLSFPYQHNFGMDVVRGLLNLESPPLARSASMSQHPARLAAPTPPPVGGNSRQLSPQLRPAAHTPHHLQESPPLPNISRKSSRQTSLEYAS
jgi:hypothetical protein